MLRAENVEVRYGSVMANKGVSISVDEGETVALLGPNGAGKTTFLSAIAGLAPISKGAIEFMGQSVVDVSPAETVRRGLALVPENRHIFATLTVSENLSIGATTVDKSTMLANLERVSNLFPILGERSNQRAGLLSGGEQQQLAIARSLMSNPRMLLLDEPSLGLAPRLVDLIFRTIVSLSDMGVTILLVEQNARKAIDLSQRVYILRNGVVTAAMSGEEAKNDRAAIEREYFGDEAMQE